MAHLPSVASLNSVESIFVTCDRYVVRLGGQYLNGLEGPMRVALVSIKPLALLWRPSASSLQLPSL